MGLVLAEPVVADVDMPPFDRAEHDGYAVRSDDALPGARLRLVGPTRGWGGRASIRARASAAVAVPTSAEISINPGETAHVTAGAAMPLGADVVIRTEDTRPEPGGGPPREVVILRSGQGGQNVVPRGYYLRAGTEIAPAGARIRLPMVGMLAAQGCVHPVCHRRVRVAVVAVGDHLVEPGEAPVMHRERNAASTAVVGPCLHWGAMTHDLGAVSVSDLPAALNRALTAPVVVVLGEPEGAVPKALKRAGVRNVFEGVSMHPGKRLSYGVVGGSHGPARNHVFHMAPGPVGVSTAVALLLGPLIARLQGGPVESPPTLRAVWSGESHRATDDRLWAVPVRLTVGDNARLQAHPVEHRGKDDLASFTQADALALLPPQSGPWAGGEVVEAVPLGAWPPGAPSPSAGL
ncbi:MAG: molybdopterin biosynthesis enzyme [Isosphaeraceae bacterium]